MTDLTSFRSSLNAQYSTSGVSWSGVRVPYYTRPLTGLDGVPYTATYFYDSNALLSAGHSVVSHQYTTTRCPTTTPTLPPSPTGSVCSPHGDHCKLTRLRHCRRLWCRC